MVFDYTLKDNDTSIDSVRQDLRFYNYDDVYLHTFDESYEDLYYKILDDNEICRSFIYPKEGFNRRYILNSIGMWEQLGIHLHDINVSKLFRSCEKVIVHDCGIFSSFSSKPVSKLRVSFKDVPLWNSKTDFVEEWNKNYKDIIFRFILLAKVEKKLGATSYAHEVAHTQLMTQDGGTNSIFNEETIPILMEFIFAYELDKSPITLKYVNNERLSCIKNFIRILSRGNEVPLEYRITAEKYIVSGIQAIELARIYGQSGTKQRKEMRQDISKLFDGERIVEDMIDKYNIDYDYAAKRKELKLY